MAVDQASEALRVSADRPFAGAVELDASAGPAACQGASVVWEVRPLKAAMSGRPRSVSFPRWGAHREAPAGRSRVQEV